MKLHFWPCLASLAVATALVMTPLSALAAAGSPHAIMGPAIADAPDLFDATAASGPTACVIQIVEDREACAMMVGYLAGDCAPELGERLYRGGPALLGSDAFIAHCGVPPAVTGPPPD